MSETAEEREIAKAVCDALYGDCADKDDSPCTPQNCVAVAGIRKAFIRGLREAAKQDRKDAEQFDWPEEDDIREAYLRSARNHEAEADRLERENG